MSSEPTQSTLLSPRNCIAVGVLVVLVIAVFFIHRQIRKTEASIQEQGKDFERRGKQIAEEGAKRASILTGERRTGTESASKGKENTDEERKSLGLRTAALHTMKKARLAWTPEQIKTEMQAVVLTSNDLKGDILTNQPSKTTDSVFDGTRFIEHHYGTRVQFHFAQLSTGKIGLLKAVIDGQDYIPGKTPIPSE